MTQLKIVQVSESDFTVQGHGVHTAFIETIAGLEKYTDANVRKNTFASADIRHIHTVGPYSLAQLLFGRGKKVISAHVLPASFVGSLVGARYWLWAAKLYLRWFYNRATVVIAVSDETARGLRDMGVRSRIEVVYNMVDTAQYEFSEADRLAARKSLGIAENAKVLLSNGQIQPRKRVDTFIEIAKQLPDVQCIWVGGMPFGKVAADAKDMQKIIDSAPSNVRFTGLVEVEVVRQYFAAGDVFVSTSNQETFGIAIIEAAAADLPIVLRDIPDYDETFRPDATMCTEQTFAKEISKLLGNKKHYEAQQKHARNLAKRYDSKEISQHLLAIYRSCHEQV